MQEALLIGAGGFLGAISRYLLAGLVQNWAGPGFPHGTLWVNLLGCLVMGYLAGALEVHGVPGPQGRLFLMVGFLGSFTTYSTFSLEAVQLLNDRSYLSALGYLGGHLLLGLVAVGLGMGLARWTR